MKQSDIKTGRFYTNGKTVRCIDEIDGVDWINLSVWWSDPCGENGGVCTMKTFSQWAKWEVNPC